MATLSRIFFAFSALSVCAAPVAIASETPLPEINAKAFVLMDAQSGSILASHNPDLRQQPTGLAKLVTGYLLTRAIASQQLKLDQQLSVSQAAWAQNPLFRGKSVMFLEPRKKVSVDELLNGLIVASGNDAAVETAEAVAGSEAKFVQKMNALAQEWGLKNSRFASVHGLDAPAQYSSARDMALISQHIIYDYPRVYARFAQPRLDYNGVNQRNHNPLLNETDLAVDGLKLGASDQDGFSIAASAQQKQSRLIAVVMGAPDAKAQTDSAKALLKWGFKQFESAQTLPRGHITASLPIYYGTSDTLALGMLNDAFITIPRGAKAKVRVRTVLPNQPLSAPITQGTKLGRLEYLIDGKVIAQVPLRAMQTVEETHWLGKLWDWLKLRF